MSCPTLHRVFYGSRNLYWVGEYPLYVKQSKDGWQIGCAPSKTEAKTWLKQQGLQSQRFVTRAEALQILMFCLEGPNAPQPERTPVYSKTKDGRYRTDGGIFLSRGKKVWDVFDAQGQHLGSTRGTLWRALWVADSLFQGLQIAENGWPAHLSFYRHQLGIYDGTDRP